MGNTKLMTPLFYQDNFNADGKKMRALFLREVSNGTDTYRLWRRDGKPDREYPQGEGDAYILYVEQGSYLAPLRMTDYYMVNHCGYHAAVAALYGDEDNRGKYFGRLRQSGGDPAVLEALGREERMIQQMPKTPRKLHFFAERLGGVFHSERSARVRTGAHPHSPAAVRLPLVFYAY